MIVLGFLGRDCPVERIGIPTRSDLSTDKNFGDLALIWLCDLAEEADLTFERMSEPVARIAELFTPVRATAIIEAGQHRYEAVLGSNI